MATKVRILLIAGVLSVLLLNARADRTPSSTASAVVIGEGWLSWSPEQRVIFVDAYLIGYLEGKSEACLAAYNLFELDKPIRDLNESVDARCFRHTKSYSRDADHYASVITQFYTEHVEYRNIPNIYLMTLLIDGRYETADEIYRAAVKREIQTDFYWK
ncbi:MAG: hypothetical protein ACRD4U_07835 [Candidatus Acidiferrales bacterium]